jgi:hypothetical protein
MRAAEAALMFLLPDLAAILSFAGRMLIFSGIVDVSAESALSDGRSGR